jgi:flavin-dependent dehydrogenase
MAKSENINNIVIVGGGTAGWMTAAFLVKKYPDKNITVIESTDIPTVGVGESTLSGINDYLNILELEDKDWMKECNASYKLSIKFTDFYDKDSGGFHYPFGSPYVENTQWGLWDWQLFKNQYPDTPFEDFPKYYNPVSALYEKNKISKNINKEFDNYSFKNDCAYHFDAALFGRYMRDKYCKPKGVKHIFGTVKDINLYEDGIENLVLEDGSIYTADLFIDCTGFKSLLLGGALEEPFESKEDQLVNNRAWAVQLPYKDKEKELQPFTNGTAIENGWCWNIPLWSRLGTGYVYSDKYVDPETAQKEFKKYLMSDKMVVPRTKKDLEGLNFKDIKMRVGIHNRTWVKNVLAIGLSAGFIEPLESNGLYSVHVFLLKLMKILDLPKVNQTDKDFYNSATKGIFENFIQFVSMHYALSHRDDTKYWQDIQRRSFNKNLVTLQSDRSVGYFNFQDMFMFKGEFTELDAGINYIATGLKYQLLDDSFFMGKKKLYPYQDYKSIAKIIEANFLNRRKNWDDAAKNAPTLYEFLKEEIYKD